MLYLNLNKIKDLTLNSKIIKKAYLNNKLVYEKIYYFSFDKDGAGWDQGVWFVQHTNRMYATRYLVTLEINKRYFEIKNLNKNNKMIRK